jgi:hypothetical protein
MKPLLLVIMEALNERGWTQDAHGFTDPEGNRHASLDQAVTAQTFREIAQQEPGTRPEETAPE